MGIVLLLTFVIYMVSTVLRMKSSASNANIVVEKHEEEHSEEVNKGKEVKFDMDLEI